METESPNAGSEAPLTRLETYRRAILDRIDKFQQVLDEQHEVVMIFPFVISGNSQLMRVYTIAPVEPDMLAFNGLTETHAPATVMLTISNLQLAMTTQKRFDPEKKAMTAFGFKDNEPTDWS